jgi:hypothetical protein
MVMIVIDLGFSWFMIFWILYILLGNGPLVDYIEGIAFEEDRAGLLSVSGLWSLLHLVFRSPKVILIRLWFFLDSQYWCTSIGIVCLDLECAWVHSRCGLLLSMGTSFVFVRPAQTVMIYIDHGFFLFLSFLILYILCRNYQLVEYIQYMLSEDGTVQLVWVLVHLRPSYTLCLVATRSFWSIRDFF